MTGGGAQGEAERLLRGIASRRGGIVSAALPSPWGVQCDPSRPSQRATESCFAASFFCLLPQRRRYKKKMEGAIDDPAGPSSSRVQLEDTVVNGADGAKPKRSRSRRAGKGREEGESMKETAMATTTTGTATMRATGKAAASATSKGIGDGVYVPPSDAVRVYARAPPPSKITTVGCAIRKGPAAGPHASELFQNDLPYRDTDCALLDLLLPPSLASIAGSTRHHLP